jgi:hypothetical protein
MQPVSGFIYPSYAFAKKRLDYSSCPSCIFCPYVTAATAGSLGARLALVLLLFSYFCFVHILAKCAANKKRDH